MICTLPCVITAVPPDSGEIDGIPGKGKLHHALHSGVSLTLVVDALTLENLVGGTKFNY